MRQTPTRTNAAAMLAATALIASLPASLADAALTDISNVPLSSASATTVKPNLLITMDTSGSMGWDFMPDNASPDGSSDFGETASTAYNCLTQSGGNNNCSAGDPPYYANQYNFVAYNPTFTYIPGSNYDGTSKGNITNFGNVPVDAYTSSAGTINLNTSNSGAFTEQVYQNSNSTLTFKRNGEFYPQGNLPPPQGNPSVTVTAFSYASPAKVSVAGVSLSGFGTSTTVTGTVSSNPIAVGDVIDVVCTNGSGMTTPYPLVNGVPVLTSGGSSFTFTAGQNWSSGNLKCTTATVNSSVVGYPEQADSNGYALTASGGTWSTNWSFSVPATTGGVTVASNKTVTVNFYNHGLIVGDMITVTGGGSSCDATNTPVTAVTLGTGNNASVPVSFQYKVASTTACSGVYTFKRQAYNSQVTGGTTPFYYTITPTEYCSDRHLTTCAAAAAGGTAPPGYPIAATLRYCKTQTGANSAASAPGVTGPAASPTAPYCQNKYLFTAGYIYPRYGQFVRTDILTGNTYLNYSGRTDCGASATCTGTQETTNFANWYAYYHTRLQMMKTLVGLSLLNLTNSYRVGFITINPASNTSKPVSSSNKVTTSHFVPVNDFTSAQKQTLYSTLYSQSAGNSTPLRGALARAGRYFAGKHDQINSGITDDPVQYSCQQNFTLLTTDGYWNTNLSNGDLESVGVDGTTVVADQDGNSNFQVVTPGPTAQQTGAYEGALSVDYSQTPPKVLSSCQAGSYNNGGCSNTLADIAAYYYNTDLRTSTLGNATGALGTDVTQNNVPTTAQDPANWQHMTTFTLGLADGLLTWQNGYPTATTGDFYSIVTGQTGCWWLPVNGSNSSVCQWPTPMHDTPTALDDLWHAAVNGHGIYYHGTNPRSVASGITAALSNINVRLATASASATSSPEITQTNDFIYGSTYDTVQWSGDVQAQAIDPQTGAVLPAILWDAAAIMDLTTSAAADTRTIYTYDTTTKSLKPFAWSNLNATEQASFTNVCSLTTPLTQCPTLSPAQVTTANDGYDLLNFIRGQRGNETTVFRTRVHVLGDTVHAQPQYVATPPFAFGDAVTPPYGPSTTAGTFQNANASRQPVLYVGGNDGMLHAFNAKTGSELWAYVPRMLWSSLYVLADTNYATLHQYYVDGSPVMMDAFFTRAAPTAPSWHTVLVGGLNGGGRGYYALDITNPTAPVALWEFCSSSSVCNVSDSDLGLSFGNPVITKRASDGRWVVLVTSGYNNVSPGTGQEFLYVLDLATGQILQKLGTATGSTTTPGGLAKINVWADNFSIDNTGKYVYGGDLLGNVWRFDLTASPATVMKLGALVDASGNPQPVTTRPELGDVQGNRVVYIGTGEYLGMSDLTSTNTQSLYAFKDQGTAYVNIRTSANLIKQSLISSSATTRTTTTLPVDWNSQNGWYVDFPTGGERVNLDPQLVLGTLEVITNIPGTAACTVGGSSWLYDFDYMNGQYIPGVSGNTVGAFNANSVLVGDTIYQLPSGGLYGLAKPPGTPVPPHGVPTPPGPASGKRTGWRQL